MLSWNGTDLTQERLLVDFFKKVLSRIIALLRGQQSEGKAKNDYECPLLVLNWSSEISLVLVRLSLFQLYLIFTGDPR